MHICAGTYNGGLIGWEQDGAGSGAMLRTAFAFGATLGGAPLRALALVAPPRAGAPVLLAAGAADESIRVFDVARRREVGTAAEHSAAGAPKPRNAPV